MNRVDKVQNATKLTANYNLSKTKRLWNYTICYRDKRQIWFALIKRMHSRGTDNQALSEKQIAWGGK